MLGHKVRLEPVARVPNASATTTFPQASTAGHLPCDHSPLNPPGAKQERKQDGLQTTHHWPCLVVSEYFQFSEKILKCSQ